MCRDCHAAALGRGRKLQPPASAVQAAVPPTRAGPDPRRPAAPRPHVPSAAAPGGPTRPVRQTVQQRAGRPRETKLTRGHFEDT